MISRGIRALGPISRYLVDFNVTVILAAKGMSYSRRMTLLSRNYSHLARIALRVKTIWCWEILNLLCGSCVVGTFLFRLIRAPPASSSSSSMIISIFVLLALCSPSLCNVFVLLSLLSRDIPATRSVSEFGPTISYMLAISYLIVLCCRPQPWTLQYPMLLHPDRLISSNFRDETAATMFFDGLKSDF
jgi:hypothetical protein